MIKTVFYPLKSENPYVSIITEGLQKAGYALYSLEDIRKDKRLAKEIRIINLNWADSIAECPLWKAAALFIRQILRIRYYKYCGMELIYTVHNRQAHDTRYKRLNKVLMGYLCREADCIAVLCTYTKVVLRDYLSEEEIQKKVRVMYHPSYEGIYSPVKTAILSRLSRPLDEMKILFMGNVRKYKNIELILWVARQCGDRRIRFLLAGKPQSRDYGDEIQGACGGLKNVEAILRYVEEDEISAFYAWSDLVIVPLSIESSLNSGSVILACTMGRTVIAPEIGTLMDFPQEELFTYRYGCGQEHPEALLKAVHRAYDIWKEDPAAILAMGQRLRCYVNTHYSIEKTQERYKALYDELCGLT